MMEKLLLKILPIAGTDIANRWDHLYLFLTAISIFFFVLCMGAMVVFIWKYRDRPGIKPKHIEGNHTLEFVWTVIPLALVLVIFVYGWVMYKEMIEAPSDSIEIRVVGKQWQWSFQYDDGRITNGKLYVPMHQPVKMIMSSEDVLHSFFIPNFRVKQDVVPGMYTTVWFEAKVPGEHIIYCAEYCGGLHSGMLAKLYVLNDEQWKLFQRGKEIKLAQTDDIVTSQGAAKLASANEKNRDDKNKKVVEKVSITVQGKRLSMAKGCVACHSADGSNKIGPSFKGLYGTTRKLNNGKTAAADENYIRESIEKPLAKVVQGYAPTMPTFRGQINETEMNALVSYIKSLK